MSKLLDHRLMIGAVSSADGASIQEAADARVRKVLAEEGLT